MVEFFLALEAAFIVAGLAARWITKRVEAVFVLVILGMASDTCPLWFDLGTLLGVAVVAFDLAVCSRELETGSGRVVELELFELALFRRMTPITAFGVKQVPLVSRFMTVPAISGSLKP